MIKKNIFIKDDFFFLKYHNRLNKLKFDFNIKQYPLIWKKIYFKEYPRLPNFLLPLDKNPQFDLFKALFSRRTKRKSIYKLGLKEISYLLFYSAGINFFKRNPSNSRRMYPSAGARYPLEIYLFLFSKIENLPPGAYHYNVKKHSLELIFENNFIDECQKAVKNVNQKLIQSKTILILITSIFGRTALKYGELTYKLNLLEAGHLGQNLYLVSQALNLNCCAIGWIDEKILNKILDLKNENEIVLYAFAIGKGSQ